MEGAVACATLTATERSNWAGNTRVPIRAVAGVASEVAIRFSSRIHQTLEEIARD